MKGETMKKAFVRLIALSLVGCGGLVRVLGGQGAGSERGAFTVADLNLYVDAAAGDDSNDCTLAAMACRTIQGAVNKIPKRLLHVVTVSVASGNYAGFVVEGFEVHPSWSASGAGLIIQGTMQPASPKTGTASGTASSDCDRGGLPDPNFHSNLTDSTQKWTPRDEKQLRGRKLCLTSGAGKGECLTIEDNTETVITLAGYWSDFHHGWADIPSGETRVGCLKGDTYAITEPATHLNQAVALPQGVGGVANGQGNIDFGSIAAIIVSNVHGGASAIAGDGQAADNFQILVKDFDVLADDWPGPHVVHSVAFVDSSDHVAFKHFTAGINTLNPNQQHKGLYSGAGLFTFRNSTAWTVQSSYANGDAPTTPSSPMISCSRSATADTVIGVFGNVVDNLPAYFGDESTVGTTCHSSVIFGGESMRNTGGDNGGTALAAITIQSAAAVYFVGTKINGSRIRSDTTQPFSADCVRLGGGPRVGFGNAYFEGGDFSNCSLSGVNIAGNWIATFINVPTTSAGGPNGQFAIEAANGAKILGLGCAANSQSPCDHGGLASLRGKLADLSFDGPNHAAFFSYSDVLNAPGQTITDPQRGGLFSFGFGEATSATSALPPNWISFGQGVVFGFTSQSGAYYSANAYDHVIGISGDAARTVVIPRKRPAGTHYIIIDTSGSVIAFHTITVTPDAGLINGAANAVITPGTNTALEVVSDGTNYWIISLK
jgi:hypothetical protein